jgi:hypothetical protein
VAERREDLRAADADREFVADRLRAALNEGRLSLSEYDDRLRQTYAARTYGDLDRLLDDLPTVIPHEHSQVVPVPPPAGPAPPASVTAPPGPDAAPRRPVAGWLIGVWSAWLIAVSVNVVIWFLVSLSARQVVYFWPMWVAGPWGTVLVAITVMGLARGDAHRHVDVESARRAYRNRRNQLRWERRQARWERRASRYRG